MAKVPYLSDADRRTEQVMTRLTVGERDKLNRLAAKHRCTASSMIRNLIVKARV